MSLVLSKTPKEKAHNARKTLELHPFMIKNIRTLDKAKHFCSDCLQHDGRRKQRFRSKPKMQSSAVSTSHKQKSTPEMDAQAQAGTLMVQSCNDDVPADKRSSKNIFAKNFHYENLKKRLKNAERSSDFQKFFAILWKKECMQLKDEPNEALVSGKCELI